MTIVPRERIAGVGVIAERDRRCSRCGCRLSRYNRETRCSGCLRTPGDSPLVPLRVLPEVWTDVRVQEALATRDFGTLCTLVRQIGNLRQEDIATLTGLSQGFLSMLESGARRLTNIDKIVCMLDGLQAPLELTGLVLQPRANATPASGSGADLGSPSWRTPSRYDELSE